LAFLGLGFTFQPKAKPVVLGLALALALAWPWLASQKPKKLILAKNKIFEPSFV